MAENDFKSLALEFARIVKEKHGVELGFDEQSVVWADDYIEAVRNRVDKSKFEGLANSIGAFLGECMIANYGGKWEYDPRSEQWGVRFPGGSMAFPMAKAWKQLENGPIDRITSFYRAVPAILNRKKD